MALTRRGAQVVIRRSHQVGWQGDGGDDDEAEEVDGYGPMGSSGVEMPTAITPTDLNARCPPSGGGRPRHNAAQRTIGVGCTLMKTNKTDSSLLWCYGHRVFAGRARKHPAPPPRLARKPGSCRSSFLCARVGVGRSKTREIWQSA